MTSRTLLRRTQGPLEYIVVGLCGLIGLLLVARWLTADPIHPALDQLTVAAFVVMCAVIASYTAITIVGATTKSERSRSSVLACLCAGSVVIVVWTLIWPSTIPEQRLFDYIFWPLLSLGLLLLSLRFRHAARYVLTTAKE